MSSNTDGAAGPLSPEIRIEADGATDVGNERNQNEDAFLIATLRRSLEVHNASPAAARGWFQGQAAGTLLVVADGMGGMGGGDLASRTAVSAVAEHLLNVMPWANVSLGQSAPRPSVMGLRAELSSALVAVDETVRVTGAREGTPSMGTTLTMALIVWPVMYVAHVGDTRCYLLHKGRLRRLTTDHNLAEKMAPDSERPLHAVEQLQNILWNSLGAMDDLPKPDITKVELSVGDCILLCSDGLNKHVDDERISSVLSNDRTCKARAAELVELANAGGGTDNVTVVVAQLRPGAPRPE